MVSMAAYGALAAAMISTAVPWSQERHSGWLRQLQITPLPGWAIILTKLVSSLLLVLPSLLLVGLAAVLTQHVSLPPGRWAALILAMWIGTIPFAALGLAIGSLLPPEAAQPVAMVGMMGLALLGGILFPESIMPSAMKTIAHELPSYDYASIGWRIIAGEAPNTAEVAGILAWGVALVALALVAYRRATVRA
ncbi:ABC transporter permease [Sphaerimonospora cavernae]|uniref:ABC transporter permease n=1 Tax=Sphaerimonospora cavernae TaxID=1740611 RepID=A0ABV6U3N4_9ACTN